MIGELCMVSGFRAEHGEGPVWDHRSQSLYWVDIDAARIYSYEPSTGRERTIHTGQSVGAVVPAHNGMLYAAMREGFFRIDPLRGEVRALIDPEAGKPDNRFNDGKCDSGGRFWAGTMACDGKPEAGGLYRLDSEESVHTILDKVTISNGLGWSPDGTTMYYIDTPTRRIDAFDYNQENGAIFNRRPVVFIPAEHGFPDGMCVDAEGNLWVAHWGGFQVSHWNPYTGQQIGSIAVPVERVTSCCFGGEALDQLYITTSQSGMSEAERLANPAAGRLFVTKLDVPGMPGNLFGQPLEAI